MARIVITPSQLREGMPLDTGWYKGTFKTLKGSINAKQDGINYYPIIDVEEADGSVRTVEDALLTLKMKPHGAILAKLGAALLNKPLDLKSKENVEFDDEELNKLSGTKIWVRLEQEVDNRNGKMRNVYDNFLPGSAPDPTASAF